MVNYRQPGIDLPVFESLAVLPAIGNRRQVSNYGADVIVSDGDRYIYRYFDIDNTYSMSQFWRYDTFTDAWQRLAPIGNSGTTSSKASMAYCKCRKYVFIVRSAGGSVNFYMYNVNTGVMNSGTSLPLGISADPNLVHTCSGINSSANDNYVYYTGGSASSMYRYSISANTWATLASVAFGGSDGSYMFWAPSYSVDKIIGLTGSLSGTVSFKEYSIAGDSVTGSQTFFNPSSAFSYNGAHLAYSNELNTLYWLQGSGEESLTSTSRFRSIQKSTIVEGVVTNEAASGGSVTTVVSAIGGHNTNAYVGKKIVITGGTGAGQYGVVKSNTDGTFTIHTSAALPVWSVAPDNTSTFSVTDNLYEAGTVTSATSTVITDSTKSFVSLSGIIRIVAGTGAGQERTISSSTATTITTSAWSITPDNTSKYIILRSSFIPDANLPLTDSWGTTYGIYSRNMCTMRINGIDYVYVIPGGSKGEWFRYQTINK